MSDGRLSLALAGGGTGGHVVPGRHLLEHSGLGPSGLEPSGLERWARVLWFVAGRTVEEEALAGLADELGETRFEKLELSLEPPGGGAPSLARLARRLPPTTLQARRALRRAGSQVVLGLGGFTSAPVVLAARSLGIPVALLEINAVAGKATRWLSPLAAAVFHAWPSSMPPPGRRRRRQHLIGPPLAPAFTGRPPTPSEKAAARAELGFEPEAPLLVVLGGSQGALGLNRFLQAHAARMAATGLQILHQAGPGRLAEGPVEGPRVRVIEYVQPVRTALRAATLCLCRGGASTLAEVAASGVPAWVVPYPHHPDQHQARNAALLGQGARIVPEGELDARCADELARLGSPAGAAERSAMSEYIRQAVPTDGALHLGRALARLAREKDVTGFRDLD